MWVDELIEQNMTLNVEGIYFKEEGRITVGETKNRVPKVIWITPELDALLRNMPEVGRLFTWEPDTVTHAFHRVALKAGLKCRLHDLRHTYASHKAMAGVDLYTLKELLGHKDIKATQIYAHLSAEHLKKAAGQGSVGGE
jgi:site-specific recombinase XerD